MCALLQLPCSYVVSTKTRPDLHWSTSTYNDLQPTENNLHQPTMICNHPQWPITINYNNDSILYCLVSFFHIFLTFTHALLALMFLPHRCVLAVVKKMADGLDDTTTWDQTLAHNISEFSVDIDHLPIFATGVQDFWEWNVPRLL